MVILLKINMALLMPDSALGKIISRSDLKIDYYLNKLTEVFERMTEDDSVGPSQTLLSFKRRMQSWLQSMNKTVGIKDESGNYDLQNRNRTTDAAVNSNNNHELRTTSRLAATAPTEDGPVTNAATTGSRMLDSRKTCEVQKEPLNSHGMFEDGNLYNQNSQNLAYGQEPVLDPSLNVPLALNEFDFGSAFPMADFLFGGMESFAGGLVFDGSGGGGDGGAQNNGFQREGISFDFSETQTCPSYIPQF